MSDRAVQRRRRTSEIKGLLETVVVSVSVPQHGQNNPNIWELRRKCEDFKLAGKLVRQGREKWM